MGSRKQSATAPTSPQDWLSRKSGTQAYLRGLPDERRLRLFAAAYWLANAARVVQLPGGDGLPEAAREAEKMADGLDSRKVLSQNGDGYTCQGPSAAAAATGVADVIRFHLPRKQSAALAHAIFEDIFGGPAGEAKIDPSWLRWIDRTVPRLAQRIYEEKDWAALSILADGLEEAGCTEQAILDHLRGPGPHVRGCWAVDLVLGTK